MPSICLIPRQIQNSKGNNRVGQKKNKSHGNIFAKHISPTRANVFVYNVDIAYLLTHIHLHIYIHNIFIENKYLSEGNICELLGKKREATVPWCIMDKQGWLKLPEANSFHIFLPGKGP